MQITKTNQAALRRRRLRNAAPPANNAAIAAVAAGSGTAETPAWVIPPPLSQSYDTTEIFPPPPEAKAAFAAEQKAWDTFQAANSKASSSLYALPDGTMWRGMSSDGQRQMIRDHTMRLLKLFEALSAADTMSWNLSGE